MPKRNFQRLQRHEGSTPAGRKEGGREVVETMFISNHVNHNIVCMWSMFKYSLLVLVVWSQVMCAMFCRTLSPFDHLILTTPPLMWFVYICKSNEEFSHTREGGREGRKRRGREGRGRERGEGERRGREGGERKEERGGKGRKEEVKREVKRREEYILEKEREGVGKLGKKEASEGWRKDK